MSVDTTGGGDAAARMLGLSGFVVTAGAEYGGELELVLETVAATVGCPSCSVARGVGAQGHDGVFGLHGRQVCAERGDGPS